MSSPLLLPVLLDLFEKSWNDSLLVGSCVLRSFSAEKDGKALAEWMNGPHRHGFRPTQNRPFESLPLRFGNYGHYYYPKDPHPQKQGF